MIRDPQPATSNHFKPGDIIHIEAYGFDDDIAFAFDAAGDDAVFGEPFDFVADDGCGGELEDLELTREKRSVLVSKSYRSTHNEALVFSLPKDRIERLT